MAEVEECPCYSVVAFGEIKRLQRIYQTHQDLVVEPTKLDIEIATEQHKNARRFVFRMEEACRLMPFKVDLSKVKAKLDSSIEAFKDKKVATAIDEIIDADIQLRKAICTK